MAERLVQRWWLAGVLALCSIAPSRARAHGQDAHIASVRISGDTVYIDATPSTGAFSKFDDDRNGLMRSDEVKAHREELLSFFDGAFRVFDEHGQRGRRIFADVSTPHAHDGTKPDGAEHLRFTFRYQFQAEPRKLRVQWFEAARDPLTVHAVRSLASINGGAPYVGYHYFITHTFPYIPRCFQATPDASFDPKVTPK